MKKLKYFIPTILWMIFIFLMSQNNGNQSSNQSNFIVNIIIRIINIDSNTLSFIIRKMAHMSEYAILFLFIYYGITNSYHINYLSLCLLITSLYAISDEFHQLFIPGRSGQLTDVLIDTCGGIIMLTIIYIKRKTRS